MLSKHTTGTQRSSAFRQTSRQRKSVGDVGADHLPTELDDSPEGIPALTLLMAFLAENAKLTTTTLLIDPANAPSLTIAQRTGFIQHDHIDGQILFKRHLK
jgi:hypothetical protein